MNISKLKNKHIYWTLVIFVFLLYGNAINNEYAVDDNIVVEGVEKVEKGFRGIPEIWTTHYAQHSKKAYGYRPTVLTTYAIEKAFFRKLPVAQLKEEKRKKDKLTQANISHFINVVLYAFTMVVLFYFLTQLLKQYNLILPLLITVLFLAHPLHTEPVNNIKSRDELLMLLGVVLTLLYFVRYLDTTKVKYLIFALLAALLAILSKRSGLSLIAIVPTILFFIRPEKKKVFVVLGTLVLSVVCFVLIRKVLLNSPAGREMMYFENPLLYEKGIMNRITMALYCSWFYLKMLIFPKEFSYYYGFNKIPLANWKHYQVWLGLYIVPVGVYGFIRFLKRDVLGLSILLWLGLMLAFSNFLLPMVGIVADRFTYLFSLGFCMVVSVVLLRIFKVNTTSDAGEVKLPKMLVLLLLIVLSAYALRIVTRNNQWHDYRTLYYHDIEHLEESTKANSMLANTLYLFAKHGKYYADKEKDVADIIKYFNAAISIDSSSAANYSNLGSAYATFMGDYKKAIPYLEKGYALDSTYFEGIINLAISYDQVRNPDKAIWYYGKGIELKPDSKDLFGLLNDVLKKSGKERDGIVLLGQVAERQKNNEHIYINMANLNTRINGDYLETLSYFEQAYQANTSNKKLCKHIMEAYKTAGNKEKAAYYEQEMNK